MKLSYDNKSMVALAHTDKTVIELKKKGIKYILLYESENKKDGVYKLQANGEYNFTVCEKGE